jgi:hypothetical protein
VLPYDKTLQTETPMQQNSFKPEKLMLFEAVLAFKPFVFFLSSLLGMMGFFCQK